MDYYEIRDDVDPAEVQLPDELSPIQKVYEGACIFITGATGFMGRVLMEKLLRTCNVARIYILVRDKKGVKSHERWATLFDDVFFEQLKLRKPGEVAKVCMVTGDCTLPDLGLSSRDKARLTDVNIVFHAAATLNVDQHLRVSYITNIKATKFLLEFAKTLPRLKAFMYVSTAYTHVYRNVVDEIFYDVTLDEEDIEEICNQLDDYQIGSLTPKLVDKWKNTYALTKACCENLISKYSGILPIGIVRPSIVVSTSDEPLQGWTNNVYGAVGVVAGVSLGVLRVWWCDPNITGDMIPVDIAINMILAATWEVTRSNKHIKIYNCISCPTNRITWSILRSVSLRTNDSSRLDSTKAIAIPHVHLPKYRMLFYIYSIWYHLIPAFFIDMFLKITGKAPMLMKVYVKIYNINSLMIPFAERNITFHAENVNRLWETLDEVDKILFNFDMEALDWDRFWLQSLKGMRVYLAKDPMETLPEGRKRRIKLQLRKNICDLLIWTVTAFLFYFYFIK